MTDPRPSRHSARLAAAIVALGGLVAGCQSLPAVPQQKPSAPLVKPVAPVKFRTFSVLPFIGVPGNPADDVISRMVRGSTDRAARITLNPTATIDFQLRGHMTAVAGDASGLVIYHFDVYDLAGRHVHRVAGQEPSGASSGDPWAGVGASTLDHIAMRTLDALAAWVARAE
ncbi:MAG: hypothetical protein JNM13_11505 [Hyphomicrobiaceae bacterium]|nr:hypothetical protein [Hyphomicrobiaceae bacterium]